ncbi:hypothetical protein BY996DRAFT_6545457 [Phakopsora pachyrhizi]|nr:hypothetical protein BY996DRAFT_6545457 [Phakopsora pachyrhizi]
MPVCNRRGKLPKAERAGLGRVGTAGRAISQGRRRKGSGGGVEAGMARRDILQGQRRKALCGLYGPTKARMRFGGIKVCLTDKEAVGREEAGGRLEGDQRHGMRGKEISIGEILMKNEVSVGLVRRRETPLSKTKRGTDIGGINKVVVGMAVGQDCRAGRARRRHTEVRSSYHFRVRTKVNSTPSQPS